MGILCGGLPAVVPNEPIPPDPYQQMRFSLGKSILERLGRDPECFQIAVFVDKEPADCVFLFFAPAWGVEPDDEDCGPFVVPMRCTVCFEADWPFDPSNPEVRWDSSSGLPRPHLLELLRHAYAVAVPSIETRIEAARERVVDSGAPPSERELCELSVLESILDGFDETEWVWGNFAEDRFSYYVGLRPFLDRCWGDEPMLAHQQFYAVPKDALREGVEGDGPPN